LTESVSVRINYSCLIPQDWLKDLE
jgi:hypothetical protein